MARGQENFERRACGKHRVALVLLQSAWENHMDTKTIRRQIRELRAEMRASGIKKTSCFNGGIDERTYRFNARLFELKCALERAEKLATLDELPEC
jgi:hypothetical protein